MRHCLFIITLVLLAVNQFSGASARAESILKTISRTDDAARLQLAFEFDQVPGFNLATTGRRIDLVLRDVTPGNALSPPATDDKMIKMVSRVEKNGMLLSFYFRYPPQRVTSESRRGAGRIVLDILLGDQQSASQPELAAPPQPTGTVRRPTAGMPPNPVTTSVYAKNWRSFFTDYESPLELLPAPRLHLPPFPLAAVLPPQMAVADWLPEETLAQARDGKWFQACLLLREQVTRQPAEQLKERLVLTYAEALVRAGEYQEPYVLLQRIVLQYPDSPMAGIATLLQIYQQADRGNPVDAYYELRGWRQHNGATLLPGSSHLLQAELALLANRFEDAERLLNDPAVASDPSLASLRQLRQADLLAATNRQDEALAAYLTLAGQSPLIETDPMSLARFANALYVARRYPEAATRYQQLVDLLAGHPRQLDLALFRLAMAQLHVPATAKKARIDLQQISNAFPGTRGGLRALLKQTDVDFIANKMAAHEAETIYGTYAVQSDSLDLREECGFKQALVNALSGDGEASVNQSMQLLRGFQSGKLRTETTALLIQQLPGLIKRLVKNGEYVKALVLAKQNKHLFVRGWLDTGLLYDLALAYSKLGMTEQTADIYQYLFEVSDEAGQERIYLPLVQSLSASGHFVQVEDYADRYLTRYPKGADRPAIFAFKIKALYDGGQADKALALMTDASSPKVGELESLKARIYFERKDWPKVIDTLTQPEMRDTPAQRAMLLPLAESYFQAGRDDEAAPLFRRLAGRTEASEQARFRLAQIVQRQNDKQEALNLFKELAEKGTDPLWTKLAGEEAAILELDKR